MKVLYLCVYHLFRALSALRRRTYIYRSICSGLKIGNDTRLAGSIDFGSEPFLISIGNCCLITDGVRFITHDGAIQVPLIMQGENLEDVYSKKSTFGRINIGDNVFIGVSSVILPETKISNDTVIAAGSVVKGDFPAGVVIGGNPAKVICSLDDYFFKNKGRIVELHSDGVSRDELIRALFF